MTGPELPSAARRFHAEISVTGAGYNGPGTLTFHLDGDRIEELVIRG